MGRVHIVSMRLRKGRSSLAQFKIHGGIPSEFCETSNPISTSYQREIAGGPNATGFYIERRT